MNHEKVAPKRETALRAEIAGTTLTITFADARVLAIDASALTPEIREIAMMHGLKQKLADAAAISRDPETGRTATVETKYRAVAAVHARLTQENQWNATRGEGGTGSGGLLYRALCRLYFGTKTPDEIADYLGKMDAKAQAALRVHPKIAPIIETIRGESARDSGIDVDELLAGLAD